MAREDHLYCPLFCEENIWQLLADVPALDAAEVWLITNADKTVATWEQRAASNPDSPVVWDYHVVLATKDARGWRVWDFDHRGPFVQPALEWLRASFPAPTSAELAPLLRCVPGPVYRNEFSSDRSHMHAPGRDDLWLAEAPDWPRIGADRPSNLMDWLDPEVPEPGRWQTLEQLRARL